MTIRWKRFAVFALCTALSTPGATLGLNWLAYYAHQAVSSGCVRGCGCGCETPGFVARHGMQALFAANAFAWLAYLVTAAGWIVDRRVSRAWPLAGLLAAASFSLQSLGLGGEGFGSLGYKLAAGAEFMLLALLLVLPATLLSMRLVAFHLHRPPKDEAGASGSRRRLEASRHASTGASR